MKLITLGCSLTDRPGPKEELATLLDVELLNLAVRAGSNQLQVNRFHEAVLSNQINKDDIVYWQITQTGRRYDRLQPEKFGNIEKIKAESNLRHYICESKNIFDNQYRIDLLCNTPVKVSNNDYNQSLQTLLATIIMASYISPKIIVVLGWNNVIQADSMVVFKDYLTSRGINFIDQPFLEYAVYNGLEMSDSMHPATSAGQQFAREVVYPKLTALGWV